MHAKQPQSQLMAVELLDFLSCKHADRVLTPQTGAPLAGILKNLFHATRSADIRQKIAEVVAVWASRDSRFAGLHQELEDEGYRGSGRSVYAQMADEKQAFNLNAGFDFGGKPARSQKVEKPSSIKKIESDLETLENRMSMAEKSLKRGDQSRDLRNNIDNLVSTIPKIKMLISKLEDTPFTDVLEFAQEIEERLVKLSKPAAKDPNSYDSFTNFNFGQEQPKTLSSNFEMDWGAGGTKPKASQNKFDVAFTDKTSFNTAFSSNDGNFFSDIPKTSKPANSAAIIDFNFGPQPSQKAGGGFWDASPAPEKTKETTDFWGSQQNSFSFNSKPQDSKPMPTPKPAVNEFWGAPVEQPSARPVQQSVPKKKGIWGGDSESDDDQPNGKPPLDDPFKEMEESEYHADQAYFGGKFGGGADLKTSGKLDSPKKPSGNEQDLFSKFNFDIQQPSLAKPVPSPTTRDQDDDLLGVGGPFTPVQTQPVVNKPVPVQSPQPTTGIDIFQLDSQPIGIPQKQRAPVTTTQVQAPQAASNFDLLGGPSLVQPSPAPMMGSPFMGASPANMYGGMAQSPSMMNPMMMGAPGMMMGNSAMMPGMQPMYYMASPTGSPMVMGGAMPMNMGMGMGMMNPMAGSPSLGVQPSVVSPIQGANLGASNAIKFEAPQKKPDLLATQPQPGKKDANNPFDDLPIDLI